jgi:hypothetical protein
VPHTPRTSRLNLLEVSTRAEHARCIVTGFSLAAPVLADLWRQVDHALSDIPVLVAEIRGSRDWLAACRLDRANLAAAALAAIAALREGELDPLCYLQDELRAQGHDVSNGQGSR